jgi:hypothetical protein
MPLGVDVVRSARVVLARRVLGDQLVERGGTQGNQVAHVRGGLLALRDLLLAAERHDRLCARLGAERRYLRDAEHGRQRREDDPTVQAPEQRDGRLDRVAPEQHDDVARGDRCGGQPGRQRHGCAAQLAICDAPVVEEERDLLRLSVRGRGEVAPEVAGPPVPLGVVALRLLLEPQRGHPELSALVLIVVGRGAPLRPAAAKSS